MKNYPIFKKAAAIIAALAVILCACGCDGKPAVDDTSSQAPLTPSQKYIETLSLNSKSLPDFYASRIDEIDIELFKGTVDAFNRFETETLASGKNDLDTLFVLINERFPQFYGDTDDVGFTYNSDKTGITWNYKEGTDQNSHHNMLVAFETSVKGLLNGILKENNDAENAIIILKNLCERFTPDYEAITNPTEKQTDYNNSAYSALVGYTGTNSAFSKGYVYLLNLAGIEAYEVYDAHVIDDDPLYTYVLVKLDGNYYFVDTTLCRTEITLKYFGLTAKEVEGLGHAFSDAYFGTPGKYAVKNYFKAEDARFSALRGGAKDYSLDLDSNTLYYLNAKGEKQQLDLGTK